MFRTLAVAIRWGWPVWLIGWLALFAVLHYTAPAWQKVAEEREFAFLPDDTPSRQASGLLNRAFPGDLRASNIVIVATRKDQLLQDEDRAFIKNVAQFDLRKLAEAEGGLAEPNGAGKAQATSIIADISSFDTPGIGGLLVSSDRHATIILIDLTTELLDGRNWPVVGKVEQLIQRWGQLGQVPAGLELSLIGSAVVGRDMTMGQRASARAVEFWTVVLVLVLLGLIYRAPLLALLPLCTVYLATQVALYFLSHMARAGWITLFEGVEIFITVILYGTGVDYCLFLIARVQEDYERGMSWRDALSSAIAKVGPALLASALTVILGIGTMIFARFGKFQTAGVAIAFSLTIGLCVVLTFSTSLLRMVGPWAFWPRSLVQSSAAVAEAPPAVRRWVSWEAFGRLLQRHPVVIWLASVLILTPFVAVALYHADDYDYDFVRRLPPDAPSIAGAKALEDHFPAGTSGIVTVLIDVPDVDFRVLDTAPVLQLVGFTDRLAQRASQLQLADIRSLALPLGTGVAARASYNLPVDEIPKAKQQAIEYYVSTTGPYAGQVTRLELTMRPNPLSRHGIAWLTQIEDAIRLEMPSEWRGARMYFVGSTADMRDLKTVTGRDQLTIQLLAAAGVLLVLILLLRRPVVSLYLIVSVLFSYFATMGAAYTLFWYLDPQGFAGLDWKVPIFLFTILVAIGEDYNIFLMSRVAEEQPVHGPVEGVHVALVRTGRIITSCGIIMAGTFAAILTGSMQDLLHLGFSFVFGVLLDTFVVRPILVPTFLIVYERGREFWRRLNLLLAKVDSDRTFFV